MTDIERLRLRRDEAAGRLGRARQAADRNPDNIELEDRLAQAELAYTRADNAVLSAENNNLRTRRQK